MKSFRCLNCGIKVIPIGKNDYRVKFCNQSCAATFNNKKFPKRSKYNDDPCLNCGEKTSESRTKFCSSKCSGDFKRKDHIQRWLKDPSTGSERNGGLKKKIREYLIEQAGNKCTECGWDKIHPITGKSPLHVDHIDGDAFNNHPDNLKVLCPNCHSLTPTYGYIGARRSTRINRYKGKENAQEKDAGEELGSRKNGVGTGTDASRPGFRKARGSHQTNSRKR